jgi:carbohydrate binding protein with CBM6 domain
VTFTVTVPETRDYLFESRSANANATPTSLRFLIDGALKYSIGFKPTGGYSSWKIQASGFPVRLTAGTHRLTLQAYGNGGAISLDSFTVI